jgi:hypothetical protein
MPFADGSFHLVIDPRRRRCDGNHCSRGASGGSWRADVLRRAHRLQPRRLQHPHAPSSPSSSVIRQQELGLTGVSFVS